ncbi:MAG TPA: TldD/PmbA family protein [Myxococcota bacterium]|nr:TldD/PmbA family protein [Myxococcota bacterium]
MLKNISVIKDSLKSADFWAAFFLTEEQEELSFRKGVQEPIHHASDSGALITVMKNGGLGYGATQDLSASGLRAAALSALSWAEKFAERSILKSVKKPFSAHQGSYFSPKDQPLNQISLEEKLAILRLADQQLCSHPLIVDTGASLWSIVSISDYVNSEGANIHQEINRIIPSLSATANHDSVTQTRTLGGMRAFCRQGGFLAVQDLNLVEKAKSIAKDAVDLACADNCPAGTFDLLIDPDQMMLQIHESIGHPLELDRILGDERNYAGTSFVTLDMFGSYQYGSPLLNITFDPTINEEFASYGFDDEGSKATREFLIKDGLLVRPLGGAVAQARANMPGVANARSSSWNRPPIDRMANLNLEPGTSSFSEMLSSIEKGLYVRSNASWSIDDSRNKFQFGCEWGQLIENGRLTKIVRNPNYRGISASFWRNLKMVGNLETFLVMGTPYCGKGEPNQCIRVGHASPVCLFSAVDIFGGE